MQGGVDADKAPAPKPALTFEDAMAECGLDLGAVAGAIAAFAEPDGAVSDAQVEAVLDRMFGLWDGAGIRLIAPRELRSRLSA